MTHRLSHGVLRVCPKAAQDLSGHLLRREEQAIEVDGDLPCAIGVLDNREEKPAVGDHALDLRVVEATPDEPLDGMRNDRRTSRCDRIDLVADGEGAALVQDQGGRPVPVVIPRGDDLRLAPRNGRDHGVGGAQVDADSARHACSFTISTPARRTTRSPPR
jgi:hypothetical protein